MKGTSERQATILIFHPRFTQPDSLRILVIGGLNRAVGRQAFTLPWHLPMHNGPYRRFARVNAIRLRGGTDGSS